MEEPSLWQTGMMSQLGITQQEHGLVTGDGPLQAYMSSFMCGTLLCWSSSGCSSVTGLIDCLSRPSFTCGAGHAAGSSSCSQGSTDLHSLVQLLAGRCPNLAATSMQLPTGALPADDWAQAAAADARLSAPAAAAGEEHPLRYLQLQEGVMNLMAVPTAAAGKGSKAAAEAAAAAAALDQGAECITLRGGALGDGTSAAMLCCAVLCCAVLCCAVPCCAVLCCAVLCCAVLCCAVLCKSLGSCKQCSGLHLTPGHLQHMSLAVQMHPRSARACVHLSSAASFQGHMQYSWWPGGASQQCCYAVVQVCGKEVGRPLCQLWLEHWTSYWLLRGG
jgi:hypothetical protein